MEVAAGAVAAEQAVSTAVEAGVAYGIAKPTPSHTATYSRISSKAFLPRVHHSLTVVNGKAYIYGGIDEKGELAGDEVHIVTLPLKGRGDDEPDYKCVPSLGEGDKGPTPGKRAGHTAVAVENRIYLYGGREADGKPIDEAGKLWVFDTDALTWSHTLQKADATAPPARSDHAAVGTEKPLPGSEWTVMEEIQNMVTKTSETPALATPYGTIFIHGGHSPSSATPLNDAWAFDIATQTWTALPSLPDEYPASSTLALSNDVLYSITSTSDFAQEIHSLPLKPQAGKYLPTSASWNTTSIPTNPLTPGPLSRRGAPLVSITTGSGRLYLLYMMGERANAKAGQEKAGAEEEPATLLSDLHIYGLPSPLTTASGLKDTIRSGIGLTTPAQTWEEVGVEANLESVDEGKAHPGPRAWMAAARLGYKAEAAVEGGHGVVIWGGRNARGEIEGDGWVVRVG